MLRIFIFANCVFLLTISSAFSKNEINPRFSISEEYNDNIFLTKSKEQDWITTVEPGITLIYDSSSVDINLDYSIRYLNYQEHNDENTDKFEDMQRASATVSFFSGRPFTLIAHELIYSQILTERNNSSPANELVNRTIVYRTSVIPEYRWVLSPTFSLIFGYSYERLDYTDPAGIDYEEHAGRISLVKQLSSNTQISGSYRYTAHQEEVENFDRQDYTLGLEQQFGPRTKGSLEVGYSDVEYEGGFNVDNSDWLLDLSYQISGSLNVVLDFSQNFEVSITDGLAKFRQASLRLNYLRHETEAGMELYWKESEYVRTDQKDQALGTRANFHLPLAKALFTDFDASYEHARFSPGTEDVNRYGFGASVGMEYRRIISSLGYKYRLNDSESDFHDYSNNIITLTASIRF